jgi:hypothetical protein
MKRPCAKCPFLRGATYLRKQRALEITTALLAGKVFWCHETVNYDEEDEEGDPVPDTSRGKFCVGALLTMENEGGAGCYENQMVRILHRIGSLPDLGCMEGHDEVFSSLLDWVAANEE